MYARTLSVNNFDAIHSNWNGKTNASWNKTLYRAVWNGEFSMQKL